MVTQHLGSGRTAFRRRDFLHLGGLAAVSGRWLSSPATADANLSRKRGGARSCILVYLLGGPPHLDLWDLKPQAPAEIRGPFQPISTNIPGLHICEHLPRLRREVRAESGRPLTVSTGKPIEALF